MQPTDFPVGEVVSALNSVIKVNTTVGQHGALAIIDASESVLTVALAVCADSEVLSEGRHDDRTKSPVIPSVYVNWFKLLQNFESGALT